MTNIIGIACCECGADVDGTLIHPDTGGYYCPECWERLEEVQDAETV